MPAKLLTNLSQDQADAYGLVLISSGIESFIKQTADGWEVWVAESNRQEALHLITEYIRENEPAAPSDGAPATQYKTPLAGLWAAAFLLFCYLASNMAGSPDTVVKAYGSSAARILNGEVYRTVTALMLHSGPVHLAGNMAGIAIFGTAVCRLAGWGVGFLMVLMTGIIGNLANAALLRYGHISIGASTAVFGAVGILAAHQIFAKIRVAGRRKKAWVPLAAGLALLAFLGAGKHSDVTAHLFGFMAGIGLGLLHAFYVKSFIDNRRQAYCLAVAVGVIALSWVSAAKI